MVVYNLGQQDIIVKVMIMIMIMIMIIVKDSSVRVNDGKYHVIRFTRDGINSSLQVDDNKVRNIIMKYLFNIFKSCFFPFQNIY